MSLYFVQKLLFQLNHDVAIRHRFQAAPMKLLDEYDLTAEERDTVGRTDIGMLFVMGVNRSLLMNFASLRGIPWDAYIKAMQDGVRNHGPVRGGPFAKLGG